MLSFRSVTLMHVSTFRGTVFQFNIHVKRNFLNKEIKDDSYLDATKIYK